MFSSFTRPHYPNAAIGIEQESVTALSVQKQGRGQYGIRQAASIPVPAGVLTPSFTETNITVPTEFAACLHEAVQNSGLLNQKRWSIALPSNSARSAILTLEGEPTAKHEIEEILDWKAEQSFGAPSGEMRILRQRISAASDGRARYFASAVMLSVIDEFETVFETLGWKSGLILPRAIGEANWLTGGPKTVDSLLISSQADGFTALLLRGDEPTVVRSVTCTLAEVDDEIYRLLMFYHDRVVRESGDLLEKILLVGRDLVPEKIREIAAEALGRTLNILRPEDVGLNIPDASFSFDELAAPAGLAALA